LDFKPKHKYNLNRSSNYEESQLVGLVDNSE